MIYKSFDSKVSFLLSILYSLFSTSRVTHLVFNYNRLLCVLEILVPIRGQRQLAISDRQPKPQIYAGFIYNVVSKIYCV